MLLSRDYTCLRTAILTPDVIERLRQKYHSGIKGTTNNSALDDIEEINKKVAEVLPGKEDLVTEWILHSLQRWAGFYFKGGVGLEDFLSEAQFYFRHYKEPMYKEAVKEWSEEYNRPANPKNLMDFTMYNLRTIQTSYEELKEESQAKKLPEQLPEGSRLIYDDGAYQIVEADTVAAVCYLGRQTQWCTRNEPAAGVYLVDSPLYIFYRNRERYAQLHLGSPKAKASDLQLKNVRNRTMKIDDGTRALLIKTGFMDKILETINRTHTNYVDNEFAYFTGGKDTPYFRKKCAGSPHLAYLYAMDILGKRFPEGEPVIARDPEIAIVYAMRVLKGRFKEAEPEIISEGQEYEYEDMLSRINPDAWQEFRLEKEQVAHGRNAE